MDISLAGASVWLPADRSDPRAHLDEEAASELGYTGLPVSDRSAPEMAVLAARRALTAAEVPVDEVGMLLHAWMYHQGHDLWSPPHYVARQLGMTSTLPVGVQQVCNGGAMSLDLAVSRLIADPSLTAVLVTTGDRFAEPGFLRWRSDYGIGYGDAGTAVVVRRGSSGLALRAIATEAAVELEDMHRGDDAFSPAPRWHSPHVDMRRTKKAFLASQGMEGFAKAGRVKIHSVVTTALSRAGVEADSLRYVVLPRLGAKVLGTAYRPALSEVTGAEVLDFGVDTGHLGAGDLIASLASLQGLLEAGETALVLNAGAGFTWSAVVVSG